MTQEKDLKMILFKIENETWGLPIVEVQEIIRLVEITLVPDAPSFVEGVINLRGNIVLVVNMRKWMKLPPAPLTLNTPLLIIKSGNLILGLIVDAIETVVDVLETAIDPVPAEFISKECIKAVVKLEDKMIFLLQHEGILVGREQILTTLSYPLPVETGEQELLKNILRQRAHDLAKVEEEKNESDKLRFIVFSINNEWYGIEGIEAKEVLRSAKVYNVPKAPRHIEGVVNVRGDIIPVIDLSKFLGLAAETKKKKGYSKILIGSQGSIDLGISVDHIEDIIEVDQSSLQQSGDLSSEETPFVKGKLEWGQRVITVLNMNRIIVPIEGSSKQL